MRTILLILGALLIVPTTQAQTKGTSFISEQIRVIPIEDTQSNRQYELYVELPESYAENPDKQYPVLYYTDAIWHIEALSANAEFIFSDVILVGISWQQDSDEALLKEHGKYISRFWDYTIAEHPKPEIQAKYQCGQAAQHTRFIGEDVIPFVEANYRADSENRAYFGYSLGGLFGSYVLLTQPETFTHYILGSPAMDGDIPVVTELSASQQQAINANVFISYGTEEKEAGILIDQLIDLLEARKDPQLAITKIRPQGSHQTAFPLTAIEAFRWMSGLIPKE